MAALAEICLHQLLKDQAEKTPAGRAVVSPEGEKTYSQLDCESDALGAYLRRHGVLSDDRVGIFMETCSDYILSCIGALKAGGAFMPLALESPDTLLHTILREAKPKVIVTKERYFPRLTSYTDAHVLQIDTERDWQDIAVLPQPPVLSPHNLAFVPYTSGTTGDPKGVMQTHGAMVASYFGRYRFSSYQPGDRVACNIFFAWEFLRPLLKGGTVYVIPDDIVHLPRSLIKYISENRITEILFTPSLLQGVLNSAEAEVLRAELESLRVVWLNGEVVTSSVKEEALAILPSSTRLFNTYSISETHDVCTIDLRSVPPDVTSACPVGFPMDGVTTRVLPKAGTELSMDGTGELYIGGRGLARGYLGRLDLDQQKFFMRGGERYYATGDVAKIDSQGMVTIIGRNDSMVKIRGYSVYLGAIEETLKRRCDVLDTAVSFESAGESNPRLVAYVVRKPGATWRVDANSSTSRGLRSLMERYVPHYMVPSHYVELDELPIDRRTGKLDRKALARPRRTKVDSLGTVMPIKQASQPLGRVLMRKLWGEALGIEAGSLEDDWDFFELGGNSLSSLGLILDIERAFGVNLDGTEVYDFPTIDRLVTHLADGESPMTVGFSLAEDSLLDPAVAPAGDGGSGRLTEASKVLVTGATGFLGAHLLDELLRCTDPSTKFYCMARATGGRTGQTNNRVIDALRFYGLAGQTLQDRIVTVTGDLAQTRFGLSNQGYRELAEEVDLVFHCAASVNYAYSYPIIKPHTVGGTLEVIKFACHAKTKPLQYISSNGIFPGGDAAPYLENRDIDDFVDRMEGGYNQAKWVAERLVWSAESRGLPVCMFRPGNIGHHSVTRVVNPNDFIALIIKACLRVNCAPVTAGWFFEMTPVDFVCTAIAKIADAPGHFGNVYNVVQQAPIPANDVFTDMRDKGWVADLAPLDEWRSRLEAAADSEDDLELKLLAQSLDSVEPYLTDTSVYDISRFSQVLRQLGLALPVVGVDYVTRFLGEQRQ